MWGHGGAASEMHVGDLAWGTFRRWPSALGALRLWSDNTGQIQVLTMFDGSGVCDLVVRPGALGLEVATEALAWAEQVRRSTDAGSAPIELRVGWRIDSPELVHLLRAQGFERGSTGASVMRRELSKTDLGAPPTPHGYVIRELREDDLNSRVAAFEAAFSGKLLSVGAYRALRRCSVYVAAVDVVATSPSGVAAFATLWLDTRNAVVQIEPAGCHPDHRRLGLTQAVILHAPRRSAELGATEAIVRHVGTNTTAGALYRSCGFETVCEQTGFSKMLE